MTEVTIRNDRNLLKSVNLPAGSTSIGRAGDNDLSISDDTVSSYHARIFTYLDSSYIEDLGSTNGTYINGKRIYKHTLHVGDVIKLGKHKIEIRSASKEH